MTDTLESKTDEALRQDVRDWLAANWTMKVADLNEFRTTPAYRTWLNKVVDARWAAPRWPVEWFGRALSDEQGYIIEQEFNRVGAPPERNFNSNIIERHADQSHRVRSWRRIPAMELQWPPLGSGPARHARL